LTIGGAAFGGTRIEKVEVSTDGGASWTTASMIKNMDVDNVWIFWETELTFPEEGSYIVNVKATDIHGNAQIDDDPNKYDGRSDWPMLKVKVEK
jgi:hypothetical protein